MAILLLFLQPDNEYNDDEEKWEYFYHMPLHYFYGLM